MNGLLFNIPPSESPRLAWLRRNGVVTHAPGWIQPLSPHLKEWLSKHEFFISPPMHGEWDEYAVMHGARNIVGEGASISDAINDAVHRGAPDPGVHPCEAAMRCPQSGKWSAVSASTLASGDTEDEAIVALAKANGWRLWSETDWNDARKS